MARLRSLKTQLKAWLESPEWRQHLPEIAEGGMASAGPLMAFLMYEPVMRLRSAVALGTLAATLYPEHPEQAKDVMRRLMWRMSEESGNIGWGVPEAYAEILVQCDAMTKPFCGMLLTTIIDLGRDDNYCDNDVLRRSCFFAIGRFLQAKPEFGASIRQYLRKAVAEDKDPFCRGYAAWALGKLPSDLNDAFALRRLAEEGCPEMCFITDGDRNWQCTVSEIARLALAGKAPEDEPAR